MAPALKYNNRIVIITTFIAILFLSTLSACTTTAAKQNALPDASLTNTYWKLLTLDGKGAEPGVNGKELSMVLATEKSSLRGFSGCNRFMGHYSIQQNQIKFSKLASTKMMCITSMQQEQQFLDALDKTVKYSISGELLYLYGVDNQPVAIFESRYMQ